MSRVIDVEPRQLKADYSDHIKRFADAIYYPEFSSNKTLDAGILTIINNTIGNVLSDCFTSDNVASGMQLEVQLKEAIVEAIDYDSLDILLDKELKGIRSSKIKETVAAQALERFETALENSIEVAVTAVNIAQTAKTTKDFKKYQSQEAVFALFGLTLSDFKNAFSVTKTNAVTAIAKKAAVVGVAGAFSVGVINPVAAQEDKNSSISIQSIAAIVPVIGNVSSQGVITTEIPTADTVGQVFAETEPIIDFTDSAEIARGKHEKPEDVNLAVNPITGKEYKPKHLAAEDVLTTKEANAIVKEITPALAPDVRDAFSRITDAIASKKLNDLAASDNDVFSPQDPFNEKKELLLPMSGNALIAAKTQSQIIRSILANDQDVIAIFNEYYAQNPPSETMLEIIKSASETAFIEEGDDVTPEQKYLALLVMHDLQNTLLNNANEIINSRQKAFNAEERKKQQSRDGVRTNNNKNTLSKFTYYDSEWNGEYKITPAIIRQVNTWPLTKEGKKLALAIIKEAVDRAEETKTNPGIVVSKVMMETAWLKDSLSRNHNNFFGIKAGSNYDGESIEISTKEDYGNGLVVIKDRFRSHDTPAEGMQDFYDVAESKIYQDAARFYLNPERYSYGMLGKLDKSKKGIIIGAQGQPGISGWSTGENVSYTEQVILAKYVSKVLPKHFLQGFDWSHETYSGSPVPKTIRGKIYYNQHDDRWALDTYRRSDSPRNYNVSTSGCMPVSLAIIVSNLTGKKVTPDDMVNLSLQQGFRTKDSGTSDAMVAYVAKKYGLKVKLIQQTRGNFIDVLQNGGMIVASGKDTVANTPGTTAGHIYTIDHVAIQGDSARFFTLDPNSTPNSFNNYSFNELSKDGNNGRDSMRLAWAFYK